MQAEGGFAAMLSKTRVTMSNDPMSVREGLRHALATELMVGLRPDDRGTAEIVLAEVLNNISEHAYAAFSGSIRLALSYTNGRLYCSVEDEGLPMPGGEAPKGHLPSPDELAEGGFGWHLIRSLTDDLHYSRHAGVNQLSFSLPAEQSVS